MKVTHPHSSTALYTEPAEKPSFSNTQQREAPSKGTEQDRVEKPAANLLGRVKDFAFDHGLLRVGMDNVSRRPEGSKVGRSLGTAEEAKAVFNQRLEAAQQFLSARGMEGRLIAKLVTADLVTVMRVRVAEHAEWHFFFIPRVDLDKIAAQKHGIIYHGRPVPELPGYLDENRLTDWVKKELGVDGFLRSHDNPLFVGRMNLGEGCAGLFDGVPEYAEVGGTVHPTREVEALALVEPDQVRNAIDHVYETLPGNWGRTAVCHQAAIAAARGMGIEELGDLAGVLNGLWLSRLIYGREGKKQSAEPDP